MTMTRRAEMLLSSELPHDFCCPISHELMTDPVRLAETGQSYERSAIEEWLARGHRTCPLTNVLLLAPPHLVPNQSLRSDIQAWANEHGVAYAPLPALVSKSPLPTPNLPSPSIAQPAVQQSLQEAGMSAATLIEIELLSLESIRAEQPSEADDDEVTRQARAAWRQGGESGASILVQLLSLRGSDGSDEGRRAAAEALRDLAGRNEQLRRIIAGKGAVPLLVEQLLAGSEPAQEAAAGALACVIAGSERSKGDAVRAGAIPLLLELVRRGRPPGGRGAAVRVLGSLADGSEERREAIVGGGGIGTLVGLLTSGLNSESSLGLNVGLELGFDSELSPSEAEAAAEALDRLAHTHRERREIVAAGAVPPLVRQLMTGSAGGVRAAARALANLATYGDFKETVMEAGAIPALVHVLASSNGIGALSVCKEAAVAVLEQLVFNSESRCVSIAAAGGIPPLVRLLESGSEFARQSSARALCWLALYGNNATIAAEAGAIPALVNLLETGTSGGKQAAAAALGAIAEHAEACLGADATVEAGGVGPLVRLLAAGAADAKEAAAAVLSTVVARSRGGGALLREDKRARPALEEMLRTGTGYGRSMAHAVLEALSAEEKALTAYAV